MRLNEMGDELAGLGKEMEKARKQHKETGSRYEKLLQDADLAMEKVRGPARLSPALSSARADPPAAPRPNFQAKSRFDTTVEELERILILKEGGSLKDATMQNGAPGSNGAESKKKFGKLGKGAGGLFKNKNPVQVRPCRLAGGPYEIETDPACSPRPCLPTRRCSARRTRRVCACRRRRTRSARPCSRRRASARSTSTRSCRRSCGCVAVPCTRSPSPGLTLVLPCPVIPQLLKQCADEIDMATQYHLSRYAFLYESQLVQEGGAVSPIDPPDGASFDRSLALLCSPGADHQPRSLLLRLAGTNGLKAMIDSVDNRTDFKTFMQNFVVARSGPSRGPRREGLYEEGYVSILRAAPTKSPARPLALTPPPPLLVPIQQPPLPPHVQNSQAQAQGGGTSPGGNFVFGFDLTDAMLRDGDEVPRILEMCAEAIEARGASSRGPTSCDPPSCD